MLRVIEKKELGRGGEGREVDIKKSNVYRVYQVYIISSANFCLVFRLV